MFVIITRDWKHCVRCCTSCDITTTRPNVTISEGFSQLRQFSLFLCKTCYFVQLGTCTVWCTTWSYWSLLPQEETSMHAVLHYRVHGCADIIAMCLRRYEETLVILDLVRRVAKFFCMFCGDVESKLQSFGWTRWDITTVRYSGWRWNCYLLQYLI